jgi:hypothetical protein
MFVIGLWAVVRSTNRTYEVAVLFFGCFGRVFLSQRTFWLWLYGAATGVYSVLKLAESSLSTDC